MSEQNTVAPESSAPSLSDYLAEQFGDMGPEPGESPEPSSSAAGSTPAEPETGTAESGATETAEGAGEAEPGSTPADAAATPDDTDPFADTAPATITVHGRPIPIEDIRVFKEGGAVIRPDRLDGILAKLAERETLSEKARATDAQLAAFTKASEWTDGDKTYTGPDAIAESRIANATLATELQAWEGLMLNPNGIDIAQLETRMVSDGKGGQVERLFLSDAALKGMSREVQLTRREMAGAIREHFKTLVAESSKPAPAPVDFASEVTPLVGQLATQHGLDAKTLTALDREILADLLPGATKDGKVSAAWQNRAVALMKERAASRQTTTQIASSAQTAAQKNAARLAAAARGGKPAKSAPVRPAKVVDERQDEQANAFMTSLNAGASALRSRTG